MTTAERSSVDVAIIGAGVSGLTAARRLVAAGRTVSILEARDRVGGRTRKAEIAGVSVDLGGQWIGAGQANAHAILKEVGLDLFPQYHKGKSVMEIGGRIKRFRGLFPLLPLPALFGLVMALHGVNRAAAEVPADEPWAAGNAKELDAMTAEDGLFALTGNEAARAVMKMATHAVWAAEPREISWLWFLAYVRAAGSFERLSDVKNAAQKDKVRGGAWQIAQRLADALPRGAVKLNAPVLGLAREGGVFRVRHGEGEVAAQQVIFAVAPAMTNTIDSPHPDLQRRAALSARMPMGKVIKFVLSFERPFWRDMGFSGQAVSDEGPVSPLFDACAPGSEAGLLVGFFEADHVGETSALGRDRRKEIASRCVRRWFGAETPDPVDYVEHDWTTDPWSRGCYVGLAQPGFLTELGALLRQPVDGVHWAGTETAREWIGYIDGAVEAGERAAREILGAA